MKLYVTSDIHLEFGDCDLENRDDVDVLILSGDIFVAQDLRNDDYAGRRVRDFLKRVSERFPHVVYVMGNHELYRGDFTETVESIREAVQEYDNFYLLDKECVTIDDYLFVGGTLWTDCNNEDTLTMRTLSAIMSDFRTIKHKAKGKAGGIWKFIAEDSVKEHRATVDYIRVVIENRRAQGDRSDRVIVVGHHAPSRLSTHPKYQHEYLMNGGYSSELDQFILDRPEIRLWTHGHTHEDFDYMIGTTRVVCNPRGYIGHERRADTWQPKLIEL